MKIRYSRQCHARTIDGESLLWHNLTFAAMLLQDAEAFLAPISREWQDLRKIVQSIAGECQVSVEAVEADFREFLAPLVGNGLVEIDAGREGEACQASRNGEGSAASSADEDLVVQFYLRHHVPRDLHIDLTSACTERCVHCYIPEYKTFLPFEMIDKAMTEFRGMGGMTVYLSGGECMLHPDFERVLRRCVELDLNCIILTNLTLCDANMVRLLAEANPHFVKVSLYSLVPGHHDAITVTPGSWRKTMDAFLACEAAGIRLELAAPVLKENQHDFAELAAFAEEHHVYLATNCDIIAKCNHDDSNLEHALSPDEFAAFLERHEPLLKRSYGDGPLPTADAPLCDVGSMRICLNSEGKYYPCEGCHGLVLGEVGSQTLREVWNGEPLNRLRRLRKGDIPKCLECRNRRWCKVCLAENFSATGDVLKVPARQCEYAAVKAKFYGGKGKCC